MKTDETKIKPIDPNSELWERHANRLARDFCPDIYPCRHCKYPVLSGYCCGYCNSSNPR